MFGQLWCRLFGHKYAPRYSTNYGDFPAGISSLRNGRANQLRALRIRERFYCDDVCTRCGNVVNQIGQEAV